MRSAPAAPRTNSFDRDVALPWGVAPIPGEPGRYYVQSKSRPNVRHIVDLTELGFNGQCCCEQFEYRCHPAFLAEARGAVHPRKHRCEHIRRALEYHGELCLRVLVMHGRQPQEGRT